MDEQKNIKNKGHIEKVYTDKATNLLKICIVISIFSFLTYLIAILLYNSFDFGLILEVISFIFILIAYKKIKQNSLQSAKKTTIIAMIPIGWLIIYDFIDLLANINEVLIETALYYVSFSKYFYCIGPYLFDVTLVATIILLYKTHSALNKAECSKDSNNCIDTFYDKL